MRDDRVMIIGMTRIRGVGVRILVILVITAVAGLIIRT
jgi:hypothetical protein